jgi:hypothetical protein
MNSKLGESVTCYWLRPACFTMVEHHSLLNLIFENNCPFVRGWMSSSVPTSDPFIGHKSCEFQCDEFSRWTWQWPWASQAQSSPSWFSSLKSLIMSSIRRIVIAASVANYRRPQKPKREVSTGLQQRLPSRNILMWVKMHMYTAKINLGNLLVVSTKISGLV